MQSLEAVWGEALQQGNISHAYLLVGTGLQPMIAGLLQRLFCDQACGECAQCKKILNQTHPDVKRVSKDGKRIKIDQIRELQSDSRYPPLEAARKAYILEDVEDLTPEAANSLLRILESPPGYVLFLLTAESTHLLPTILSRCQVVRLSPTSLAEQEETLRSFGLDGVQLELALGIVGGLPERLDRLMPLLRSDEQSLAEQHESVLQRLEDAAISDVIALFAEAENLLEEREAALKLISLLREMNDYELLEAAQAISKLPPERGQSFLGEALRWHRDLLLTRLGDPHQTIFNRDKHQQLQAQAHRVETERLAAAVNRLENGREVFQGNANLQLFFESLLLTLAE